MTKKYNYTKPTGRPSKYDAKYCDEIIKFFDIEPYKEVVKKRFTRKDGEINEEFELRANDMRFLSQFARKIDVTTSTLLLWAETHPEFSIAYNSAKELQQEHLVTNALQDTFSSFFAFQTAKNIFGWRDKIETEHTGDVSITLKGLLHESTRPENGSRVAQHLDN